MAPAARPAPFTYNGEAAEPVADNLDDDTRRVVHGASEVLELLDREVRDAG